MKYELKVVKTRVGIGRTRTRCLCLVFDVIYANHYATVTVIITTPSISCISTA